MEGSDAGGAAGEPDANATDADADENVGDAVDGAASEGDPGEVAVELAPQEGDAAGGGAAPETGTDEEEMEQEGAASATGSRDPTASDAARDGDRGAARDGEPDGAAGETDGAPPEEGVGAAPGAAGDAAGDVAATAGDDEASADGAPATAAEAGGAAAAGATEEAEASTPAPDDEEGDEGTDGDATEGRVYGSDDVAKYDRFKKIESSEYDRVNDFLRKRTYVTAREWAIARLCTDFRTETGVEMTLIGENLPDLVPFMTDEYSPQAVNQARSSFVDKVKKAGSTFLYGSMSGFFTTEELDDVMYEVTETARFLLEVEGAEIAAEHEMEVEDRISDAMREIQEGSAELRAEETEHTCPHCGGEFTEDEEP